MNPFDLLKNIQQMQSNMEQMQAKLKTLAVQGTAGGDLVRVELNGQMEMLSVHLDPACVDKGDIPMLQDLICSAHADAMQKVRDKIKDEFGSSFPGMNLPGQA